MYGNKIQSSLDIGSKCTPSKQGHPQSLVLENLQEAREEQMSDQKLQKLYDTRALLTIRHE